MFGAVISFLFLYLFSSHVIIFPYSFFVSVFASLPDTLSDILDTSHGSRDSSGNSKQGWQLSATKNIPLCCLMLLSVCFIACLPFCKHSFLDTISWNLHPELRKSVTSNAVARVYLSNVPLLYAPALSCWLRHHAGCSSTHLLHFHFPGKHLLF